MSAADFVAALKALRGLTPLVVTHLMKLAPLLRENEREDTLEKLAGLDDELRQVFEERGKIAREGIAQLRNIESQVRPVRRRVESEERRSAVQRIEDELSSPRDDAA